jgi:hypothetical protein
MDIRFVTRALVIIGALLASAGARADTAITVLSSRPDMVSGGSALVAVEAKGSVTLNGADVTAAFKPAEGGKRIGLVEGLKLGKNELKAGGASLDLINHPITGPVFSGPHETPFVCMTDKFTLPASKETLGAALDADCSVKTRVDWVYRTKGGEFKPLPAGAAPDDVAMIQLSGSPSPYPLPQSASALRATADKGGRGNSTSAQPSAASAQSSAGRGDSANAQRSAASGQTVPYVVRVETGTINRAIYQIAMLADPAAPAQSAWNGKLVYTFGGGCVGGWYVQGSSIGNRGILEDLMLRQGYAVASSTLNVFGNNCSMLIAAETLAMVKEHFIKSYGVPKFTIGVGCSGGSEQLHPIADAYPGLVDGIIVGCSFPEVLGGMVLNLTDADLMAHYFKTAKLAWSDEAKAAAAGYPNATTATTLAPLAVRIKAEGGACNAGVPQSARFARASNPKGVRCDVYDHTVNVLGRDATGAALRTWDNVGVQYGLAALKTGAISAQQFLELNRAIGGFDNDGNYSAARGQADLGAVKRAYESGQITYGGLGLKSTPVIDYRGYVDAPENAAEEHSRFHSFSLRARLMAVNGSAANHVMLIESGLPGTHGLFSDESPVLSHALTQMDEWLSGLNLNNSGWPAQGPAMERPSMAAIEKAKPKGLVDACFTDNGETKIAESQVYKGETKCNRLYPSYSSPRMVAGEPIANNVLKCQLKAIDAADYGGKLEDADLAALKTIFPQGVCDYAKPGIGQVPIKATWQSF